MRPYKPMVLDRLVLRHLDAAASPRSASELAGREDRMELSVSASIQRLEREGLVMSVARPKSDELRYWATTAGKTLVRRAFR